MALIRYTQQTEQEQFDEVTKARASGSMNLKARIKSLCPLLWRLSRMIQVSNFDQTVTG